jgi:myo-inositol-1(or 4)-monophosphatase
MPESGMSLSAELAAAVDAAQAAGVLLRSHFGQVHEVQHKGPTDLVTRWDREAEDTISAILQRACPAHGVLGEERGAVNAGAPAVWAVDPLDGTANYVHGLPFFAVSIGLLLDKEPVLGVVYNPVLEELFVAERGRGATLNGRPIHVSQATSLATALVATGFGHDVWGSHGNLAEFRAAALRARAIRCYGSAAMDLCSVAMGRVDGYWEMHLEPWDMVAGAAIVVEAGGTISRVDGSPFDPLAHGILACNGHLQAELLDLLHHPGA